MLDNVLDIVYFPVYLNIYLFSSSCPLKRKLLTVTSVINQPTKVFVNTQEQDLSHVSITFLLILYNFVLKLYPYPLDAVTTVSWLIHQESQSSKSWA